MAPTARTASPPSARTASRSGGVPARAAAGGRADACPLKTSMRTSYVVGSWWKDAADHRSLPGLTRDSRSSQALEQPLRAIVGDDDVGRTSAGTGGLRGRDSDVEGLKQPVRPLEGERYSVGLDASATPPRHRKDVFRTGREVALG